MSPTALAIPLLSSLASKVTSRGSLRPVRIGVQQQIQDPRYSSKDLLVQRPIDVMICQSVYKTYTPAVYIHDERTLQQDISHISWVVHI